MGWLGYREEIVRLTSELVGLVGMPCTPENIMCVLVRGNWRLYAALEEISDMVAAVLKPQVCALWGLRVQPDWSSSGCGILLE